MKMITSNKAYENPIVQKSRVITLHKHGGVSTSSPQRNNKISATNKMKLLQKINNHGDTRKKKEHTM